MKSHITNPILVPARETKIYYSLSNHSKMLVYFELKINMDFITGVGNEILEEIYMS